MNQPAYRRFGLIWVLVVGSAAAVSANGAMFFTPPPNGPVNLQYFGTVKDAHTRRPISQPPEVTIDDVPTTLHMPFDGDRPGHFVSPDVGDALQELTAGDPVDTKQLKITFSAKGYKTLTLPKAPRKTQGRVQITVYLEPETPTNAGESSRASGGGFGVPWTVWVALIGGMAVAVAAMTRTRRMHL